MATGDLFRAFPTLHVWSTGCFTGRSPAGGGGNPPAWDYPSTAAPHRPGARPMQVVVEEEEVLPSASENSPFEPFSSKQITCTKVAQRLCYKDSNGKPHQYTHGAIKLTSQSINGSRRTSYYIWNFIKLQNWNTFLIKHLSRLYKTSDISEAR